MDLPLTLQDIVDQAVKLLQARYEVKPMADLDYPRIVSTKHEAWAWVSTDGRVLGFCDRSLEEMKKTCEPNEHIVRVFWEDRTWTFHPPVTEDLKEAVGPKGLLLSEQDMLEEQRRVLSILAKTPLLLTAGDMADLVAYCQAFERYRQAAGAGAA